MTSAGQPNAAVVWKAIDAIIQSEVTVATI
jgi:hypothetical protein